MVVSPMQCKHITTGIITTLAALLVAAPAVAGGVKGIEPKTVLVSSSIAVTVEKRLYIVQLDDVPAVGLQASNEATTNTGRRSAMRNAGRFDVNDSRVRQHVSKLRAAKDKLLSDLNAQQDEVYSYDYTFNGLAVMLTPAQADKLRFKRGVRAVWEDQQRVVMSGDSAAFLGLLNGDAGLQEGLDLKGEDIIIGVIDSGVAPNHPSFADRVREEDRDIPGVCDNSWARASLLGRWLCGKYYRDDGDDVKYSAPPAAWKGTCETGDGFDSDACNNKLIGARFYRAGFDTFNDIDAGEFDSPADADGHGTHVASIAAGNELKNTRIFGQKAGSIRGIAPRARVAVYKACWLRADTTRAVCSLADLVEAIDDAVQDGVDVINYSIGSLDFSLTDPDDLALLKAADAGVITAVSAGNDGPTDSIARGTIESPGATPWVITVGASTRPGSRIATGVQIDSPASLAGNYESKEASFTPQLKNQGAVTAQLVLIDDGDTASDEAAAAGSIYDGCSSATNSGELRNNIAFIQRGNCQFDTKVSNAATAGAVAVVVFSNDEQLLVMEGADSLGTVPAVMIGQSDGELIRDQLLEGREANITLDSEITVAFTTTDNVLANFSARGPDPDFLKPDVIAPGKTILGGHTPDVANGFKGEEFQYLTGTSQAAPQVAGLAALIKEAQPDWSPAEIKSAIMTTARQDITLANGDATDPFDIGAGHIVPNSTIDPGLLYDVATDDFDEFLCRTGQARKGAAKCTTLLERKRILRANDLNLPSIQINDLVATREVKRRVRNPGLAQTFIATVTAPEGVTVEVTPAQLVLGADQEAEFTVSFSSDGQTFNDWLFGDITWASDTHSVYSPFAVISTFFDVPAEIQGEGETGSLPLPVQFGYNGGYQVKTSGLTPPCVFPLDGPDDPDCVGSSTATVAQDLQQDYQFQIPFPVGVSRFEFTVAQDELHLRAALFNKLTDGNDDLDLYVWKCGDPDTNQVFIDANTNTSLPLPDGDNYQNPEEFSCLIENVRFIGASTRAGTSKEVVDFAEPTAGYYIIDVHGFSVDSTNGTAGAEFNALVWAFGAEPEFNNLNITGAPGAATNGFSTNLDISWAGLDRGLWLGGIVHSDDGTSLLDYTLIEVDNIGFSARPLP